MACRKDVKDLTPTEKAEFVQALIDLKQAPSQIAAAQTAGGQGRYDDYVWIHRQVQGGAHNAPAFTPWHREFLYQLERDLQTVSGNPNLTIPYWDWTRARTPSDPGWPFTADFLGGLGAAAADSRVTTGRFATDPANPGDTEWRINIPDAETGNYLKRRGAPQEFPLPDLARARTAMGINIYDAAPFILDLNTISDADFQAAVFASFRKFLEFALHNGPHPWVGTQAQFSPFGTIMNADLVGSMTWQASPNDPAFWLHHCNIDRLWAIWQQRYSYPGYLPQAGGTTMQNGGDVMALFNTASFFNFPQHATPNSNENHKTFGYLYPSDVPEVPGPIAASTNFGDVPNGLTTHKPVQFTVTSCQPVKFRITAINGAGFSDPYPGAHTVLPAADASVFTADVYVAYTAPTTGAGPVGGSVTIEAFFEDPDRLFVPVGAPNDEAVIGSWTISLVANVVTRPQTAVALTLDRSGSMSSMAGGGLTRFNLLESAVEVVSDLMRDLDAMGLVYFDHNVTRRINLTAMTAAGGKADVAAALADPALEPSGGSTAIGSAMIEAADVISDEMSVAGTPYSRFAMLVMTDGNENVLPYADEPPVISAIAPFSSEVYAVGLGREGEVSDATLGAIANYMLITGDMDATEREFRLTKYFVQILAGITNLAIVTDPGGDLTFGVKHRVEFDLTTADLEADIVALSPLAFLIDMELEAPDGTILTPSSPGPNGSFHRNFKDIFYRLRLPALPGKPNGSHGGKWAAILSLAPERVKELVGKLDNFPELLERLRGGVIPYSVVVQSYSNVSLKVQVEQPETSPGTYMELFAALSQYMSPLAHTGRVRVEITDPTRTVSHVTLHEHQPGKFLGSFKSSVTGVYRCRFLASGTTIEGEAFMREETRTAAIYRRPPKPARPTTPDGGSNETICTILDCLLDDDGIRKILKSNKVDAERLRECLKAACGDRKRLSLIEGTKRMRDKEIGDITDSTALKRQLPRRVASLLAKSTSAGILETPAPRPIKARPDQKIPMNPLGGMWPMIETKDGGLKILLKGKNGKFDPPEDQWKQEDESDRRREPKLPEVLAKRLSTPKSRIRRGKSK